MEIAFFGAAETVTGSQHLITVNEHRILLDCGLYEGKRDEARRRNRELPFAARMVDTMVLSHANGRTPCSKSRAMPAAPVVSFQGISIGLTIALASPWTPESTERKAPCVSSLAAIRNPKVISPGIGSFPDSVSRSHDRWVFHHDPLD